MKAWDVLSRGRSPRYTHPGWLLVRAGFVAATGLIVLQGLASPPPTVTIHGVLHETPFDAAFTGLFLLPVLLFAVGVWRPVTVLVCGSLLFLLTATGWASYHQDPGTTKAIELALDAMWSTAICVAGTIWDFVRQYLQKERLRIQAHPLGPIQQQADEARKDRPRAW